MAGKIVHFELAAKDAKRAQAFYSKLFGWKFKDAGMPGMEYYLTEGVEPAGALDSSAEQGPYVYFDSQDIDATVRRIRELGGKADDKQPIPGVGWFSRVVDPEGNAWGLFQTDPSVQMPEPQAAGRAER